MKKPAALLSLVLLSGCITLLPKPGPAPATYVLGASDVAHADGAPVQGVIAVATPEGERTLLGTDLVWRTGDQIAFISGTRWSARAEDALQSLLVQTLARQGRFAAAVREDQAAANFEVRWDLIDFEIDNASMQAKFAANVTVLDATSRRVIASQLVTANAPVASRSASLSAEALTRAAREGSARIGVFAAETVSRAQTSAASISR
ncbi:MAG: ABC-type transport auxiliary lipoprotein family protein [Alphaproteobacteria bacterium]